MGERERERERDTCPNIGKFAAASTLRPTSRRRAAKSIEMRPRWLGMALGSENWFLFQTTTVGKWKMFGNDKVIFLVHSNITGFAKSDPPRHTSIICVHQQSLCWDIVIRR
jgi:hypothetical protein